MIVILGQYAVFVPTTMTGSFLKTTFLNKLPQLLLVNYKTALQKTDISKRNKNLIGFFGKFKSTAARTSKTLEFVVNEKKSTTKIYLKWSTS